MGPGAPDGLGTLCDKGKHSDEPGANWSYSLRKKSLLELGDSHPAWLEAAQLG